MLSTQLLLAIAPALATAAPSLNYAAALRGEKTTAPVATKESTDSDDSWDEVADPTTKKNVDPTPAEAIKVMEREHAARSGWDLVDDEIVPAAVAPHGSPKTL